MNQDFYALDLADLIPDRGQAGSRRLHPQLLQFLLQFLDLGIPSFDFGAERLRRRAGLLSPRNQRGDYAFQAMIPAELLHRYFSGNGFHTPHAGGDAAFAHDLDQADLAGGGSVGAAAELDREVPDLDHAHALAV